MAVVKKAKPVKVQNTMAVVHNGFYLDFHLSGP